MDAEDLRPSPGQDVTLALDASAPAPWQEIRIPFEDLFDAEGHLRIRIKYTRGC